MAKSLAIDMIDSQELFLLLTTPGAIQGIS